MGRGRPQPRLTQWLCWDSKPGLHPWQQAAQEFASTKTRNKCTEYKRQLPGGLQVWQSPKPLPTLLATSHPELAGGMRLQGSGNTGLPWQPPALPVGRVTPLANPCELQAPGQAGSSWHINPAQVLSSRFLLVRMIPHICSQLVERCEQGPVLHWVSLS